MAWAWVEPADKSLLAGRPLLDLGTGDGQTLQALVSEGGLIVGVDRSAEALRVATRTAPGHEVCATAGALPFPPAAFAVVVAADLFHHLTDDEVVRVTSEAARVLVPRGRLLAWWYERPGRPAPDAPRYPRPLDAVTELARASGLAVRELPLRTTLPVAPTVGLVGTR